MSAACEGQRALAIVPSCDTSGPAGGSLQGYDPEARTTRAWRSLDWAEGRAALLRALRALCRAAEAEEPARALAEARAAIAMLGERF